mmetsp:Transcript_5498/g.11285  ORF Transcript_5498/g.11285 Transcript_5498/m.11285 type:complete len:567 (+) Transcript_5498:143-1843(+)
MADLSNKNGGGSKSHQEPNSAPLSPRSRRKSAKATSSSSSAAAAAAANKKKCALSPQTVEYLKSWILHPAHIEHPYPTEEEKSKIMAETGIELKQLTNWFVNNRKRFWKPKVEELKRQMSSGTSGLSGCGTLAEAAAKAGVQLASEDQPSAHASKKIKLTSQSSSSSIRSSTSSSASKSHSPMSPILTSSSFSNSSISIMSSPREMKGKTFPPFRQKPTQSQRKSQQQLLEDELLVSPTTVIDPLLATTSTSALDAFQFDDFNLIPPSASCEIQDPIVATASAANIKLPSCPPILPLTNNAASNGGNANHVNGIQSQSASFQNLEVRRHSVASFNSASNTFQVEDATANDAIPTSSVSFTTNNQQPAATPSANATSVNRDGGAVAATKALESSTTTLASAMDTNFTNGFEGFNCGVGFCDHLQNKMNRYVQPCALCSACRDWNLGEFCPWDLTGIIGDMPTDGNGTIVSDCDLFGGSNANTSGVGAGSSSCSSASSGSVGSNHVAPGSNANGGGSDVKVREGTKGGNGSNFVPQEITHSPWEVFEMENRSASVLSISAMVDIETWD